MHIGTRRLTVIRGQWWPAPMRYRCDGRSTANMALLPFCPGIAGTFRGDAAAGSRFCAAI